MKKILYPSRTVCFFFGVSHKSVRSYHVERVQSDVTERVSEGSLGSLCVGHTVRSLCLVFILGSCDEYWRTRDKRKGNKKRLPGRSLKI